MRRGFTLVELVVVLLIILMLTALLIPAQRGAREAARRNNCSNAVRQLVLAALNHESATQRFPRAIHGTGGASHLDRHVPQPFSTDDGYSYLVPLLAYMEENALAEKIREASQDFLKPINSADFVEAGSSIWNQPVHLVICPSFPGENIARGRYPTVAMPQVSNYHAMVAACVEGPAQQFADGDLTGGVIVTPSHSPTGLTIHDVSDGTSRTIMITESRAENWSAWFSASSVSTVALPPDVVSRKDLAVDSSGYLAAPAEAPSGLNFGYALDSRVSSSQSLFWASKHDRREWGPSAAHEGEVVMQGFADGHVQAINGDIDATTYFHLVTRNGGEPASSE